MAVVKRRDLYLQETRCFRLPPAQIIPDANDEPYAYPLFRIAQEPDLLLESQLVGIA